MTNEVAYPLIIAQKALIVNKKLIIFWNNLSATKKDIPVGCLFRYGGGKGIRTLVGFRPNGFQDRRVMTASLTLHSYDCTCKRTVFVICHCESRNGDLNNISQN